MNTPTVPNDPISEKAALCLLSAGGQVAANAAPWSQDLFYDPIHKQVFEIIADQLEAGKPTDYLALCQLENAGKMPLVLNSGNLTDILLTLPPECWGPRGGPSLAKYYFDILNDCLQRRGYMEATLEDMPAVRARTLSPSESVEHISAASTGIPHHEVPTNQEICDEFMAELEGRSQRECFAFGLPAIPGTDYHLDGGIHRGELCVIAGKPGSGKSVMLSMAAKMAAIGEKKIVLFITLEMPPKDIMARITANVLGKRVKNLREYPSDAECQEIAEAAMAVQNSRIAWLSECGEIAEVERQVSLTMPDLLVLDYIQQVKAPGDTRAEIIAEVARRLKLLAMKQNIAVLTAAQINDQGELRESRAIGMDSDIVLAIEWGSEGKTIVVRKNRRGPTGVSEPVFLNAQTWRFEHRE